MSLHIKAADKGAFLFSPPHAEDDFMPQKRKLTVNTVVQKYISMLIVHVFLSARTHGEKLIKFQ